MQQSGLDGIQINQANRLPSPGVEQDIIQLGIAVHHARLEFALRLGRLQHVHFSAAHRHESQRFPVTRCRGPVRQPINNLVKTRQIERRDMETG